MGQLNLSQIQLGDSATASNNFVISVPATPDGTLTIARGNVGATTSDILSVGADDLVTLANRQLTMATAQAATSGTSKDFTGIPSWVNRITIELGGVSTNGTSIVTILIGTGATPTYVTSGYLGTLFSTIGSAHYAGLLSSAITTADSSASTWVRHGAVTFSRLSGNTWAFVGAVSNSDSARSSTISGSIALGAELTALRLTTVNGTDTFDAGSVNIMYEG